MNIFTKKTSMIMLVFGLAAMLVFSGCRKSGPPASQYQNTQKAKTGSEPNSPVSQQLTDIINAATSWAPILSDFYGKQVPDFTVNDITGKAHKLSDYRGKDVMIVFWATWCMPCEAEIPHLIALRNIFPADKLAILAISNEPVDTVKAVADSKKMNYTVISYQGVLPMPLSGIRAYPSAFFIRPDGTLKLCTEGGLHLGEMKSIILAK